MEGVNELKRYQVLENILNEVNKKCVRMNSDNKAECVQVAFIVVSEVIQKLKDQNNVFKQMYSRTDYVGSYFDGLRVKNATEFDLNLIIKLPLNYKLIKVENTNVASGFVKVNIGEAKNDVRYSGELKKVIDKWCDGNGYVQQNRFREYMEGMFSKTFGQNKFSVLVKESEVQVQLRKCGPAFTLMIFLHNNQIDVDLVFTLEFKDKQPPPPIRWNDNLNLPWVLVPKELTNHKDKHLFWRISFPTAEKKLLKDQYKLKFTNRLIKALRDLQNLSIPSYFIKTIFLWEAHECLYKNKKHFWEQNLGYLFIYALRKLHQYLSNKRLPYYWHKKMNLFIYNESHIGNMAGRISNILKKIDLLLEENNHSKLRNYILSLFRIDNSDNDVGATFPNFQNDDDEEPRSNLMTSINDILTVLNSPEQPPNNNGDNTEEIIGNLISGVSELVSALNRPRGNDNNDGSCIIM